MFFLEPYADIYLPIPNEMLGVLVKRNTPIFYNWFLLLLRSFVKKTREASPKYLITTNYLQFLSQADLNA